MGGTRNGHADEQHRGSGQNRHEHEDDAEDDEERSYSGTTGMPHLAKDAVVPWDASLASAVAAHIRSGTVETFRGACGAVGAMVAIEERTGKLSGAMRLPRRRRRRKVAKGMVTGIPQRTTPTDRLPRVGLVALPIVAQIPKVRLDALEFPIVQPHAEASATHIDAHTVPLRRAQKVAAARTS
jgi:hypothetical protein